MRFLVGGGSFLILSKILLVNDDYTGLFSCEDTD